MATEKRLIDANALIKKARWMEEPDGNGINCDILAVYVCAIENAPTVDAVEVVRCKDCKHFWESFSGTHSCKLHKGLVGTKYDTFCSYGERKDND